MPLSRLARLLAYSAVVVAFNAAAQVQVPVAPSPAPLTAVPPKPVANTDFQEATIAYRAGEYGRAMERIDAWLKARPKDARGRFLRGMILTAQKKPDDAVRVYLDLTQDYPELPEPYNNLAVLYAAQGDYDKARVALENAINAMPGFAPAHENLGDIYTRLAAQSYEKTIKLDTTNKTAPAKLKAMNDIVPPRR